MASFSDNINSRTLNDYIGVYADWAITRDGGGGGGSMRVDNHNDHSDGTLVVDFSNTSFRVYAIWQTLMDTADHEVEIDAFLDTDTSHTNNYAVVLRADAISTTYDVIDGYACGIRGVNGSSNTQAYIERIDNGAGTDLATSTITGGKNTYPTIKGQAVGNTIKLFIDGVEELSVSDSTYNTQKAVGVEGRRQLGSVNSQPFWDNFAAQDVSISTVPDAITTLAATPGDTQVSLSWTAPNDGGAAITDYTGQYRVSQWGGTPLDSDDFTSQSSGTQILPRTNWTASSHGTANASGWLTYKDGSLDVLYSSSNDQWMWYDTGVVNHAAKARVKTSLTNNAIGGVVVGVDTTNPYKHIGFELVYTGAGGPGGAEDKLILYYKTGTTAGSEETILWQDTSFGFSDETFYDLELAIEGGVVTAKIDGTVVHSAALSGAFQTAMAGWDPHGAGLISYNGSTNFDDMYVFGAPASWSTFADGTSTAASMTITSLTNGTEYDFRVAAVNSVGTAAWSNVVTATPVAAGFDGSYIYAPTAKRRLRTAGGSKLSLRDATGARWEV